MKIISAKYGTKDVTEIVQALSSNNRINFFVSNTLFGDPNIGILKKLVIQIENEEKLEADENTYLVYPKNFKEKLGIFIVKLMNVFKEELSGYEGLINKNIVRIYD